MGAASGSQTVEDGHGDVRALLTMRLWLIVNTLVNEGKKSVGFSDRPAGGHKLLPENQASGGKSGDSSSIPDQYGYKF